MVSDQCKKVAQKCLNFSTSIYCHNDDVALSAMGVDIAVPSKWHVHMCKLNSHFFVMGSGKNMTCSMVKNVHLHFIFLIQIRKSSTEQL